MKRNLIVVVAALALFAPVFRHVHAKGSGLSTTRNLRMGNARAQDPGNVKTDPYAFLQDALRKPGEGEKQIQGTLTRVDCDTKSGITFVIKIELRTLRLRTDRFESMQITTYTSDVAGDITCGIRKPEDNVVICYLPLKGSKAKADGTAKSLEFVPKDFKLPPEAKPEKPQ